MQTEYNNSNERVTLGHIEKNNETIEIQYLRDSNIDKIPYTVENWNKLINRMLDQAKERNESKETQMLFKAKNIAKPMGYTICALDLLGILLNLSTIASTDSTRRKISSIIFIVIFIYIICKNIYDMKLFEKNNSSKLEELEKYDIFLTLQDDFERNGITINDLDSYSLDEIKQIENDMNEKAKVKKLV